MILKFSQKIKVQEYLRNTLKIKSNERKINLPDIKKILKSCDNEKCGIVQDDTNINGTEFKIGTDLVLSLRISYMLKTSFQISRGRIH